MYSVSSDPLLVRAAITIKRTCCGDTSYLTSICHATYVSVWLHFIPFSTHTRTRRYNKTTSQ